jgi:hypothetical protein
MQTPLLPFRLLAASFLLLFSRPRRRGLFGFLVGLLLLTCPSQAQAWVGGPIIRYVKVGSTGDGSSWASASGDLQAMINTTGVTEVWVAGGTFKPTTTINRRVSFAMKNGVAIYGGFVGTETDLTQRPAVNPITGMPSSTTLSGDIGLTGVNSDNSYHVIQTSSLDKTAVLDGFVITGGNADGASILRFGGGIYNFSGSSPTLTNCSLQNNSAISGGGIFNNSGSSPTLTNCNLQSNSASFGGGGIYNSESSPTLINCSLQSNSTTGNGGGIWNTLSSPTITNCSLLSNSAISGGGIYNTFNSNPKLANCVLWDNGGSNTASNDAGPDSREPSTITVTYSLFESSVTGFNTGDTGNKITATSPFSSTNSVALAPNSPAINAGNNAAYMTANGRATDLVGNARIFPVNGQIDMGAIETILSVVLSASPNPICIGGTTSFTGAVTGGTAPYSYTWAAPQGIILSGTSTSVVSATAGAGVSGIQTLTITVADATTTTSPLTSTSFVSLSVIDPPTRLYVNASATGANTGLSWPNAFTSLQSALTHACSQSLTEVWIAGGLYKPAPAGTPTAAFQIPSGLKVYGGFVGATTANPTGETDLGQRPNVNPSAGNPSSTTLSGDIDNDGLLNSGNSQNVVRLGNASADTRLDGVVVTGGIGDSNSSGGGIQVSGGNPALENLWVTGNGLSGTNGGGIATLGSSTTLLLTNSHLSRNRAPFGGGIYAEGPAYLTGVNAGQNTASSGGGFYSTAMVVSISSSTLTQNLAAGQGGGAVFTAGSLTVTGSNLSQNTATNGFGGAIFANNADLISISSSTLSQNQSAGPGGCVQSNREGGVTIRVQGSIMNQNQSNFTDGGAIFARGLGNTLSMNGVTMNQNSSNSHGGAIYLIGPISLTDCNLSQNQTSALGGAIFQGFPQTNPGYSFSATSTTLIQNTASVGGAVHGAGNTYLSGCLITGNQARGDGGGIVLLNDAAVVDIVSSTLSQNTAMGTGGALVKSEGNTRMTLTIKNSVMNNNESGSNGNGGGAIFIGGSRTPFGVSTTPIGGNTTLTMSNTQMRQNRSSSAGGAINVAGPIYLTDCTISQNTATRGGSGGGGISQGFGNGVTAFSAVNSIISQNLSNGPGGGVQAFADVYLTNCNVSQNSALGGAGHGAGISANSPQIFQVISSTLNQNSGTGVGGALSNFGTGLFTLTDVVMIGNGTTAPYGQGGAVFSSNPSTTLVVTNAQIRQNVSVEKGGGISASGPTFITGCDFSQNTATGPSSEGGGLYLGTATGLVQITNSRFVQNQSVVTGGALSSNTAPMLVVNNVFSRNAITGNTRSGGAIRSNASLTVVNSSFSSNSANTGGALDVSSPSVAQNTIFWGNGPTIRASSGLTLTNSLIEASQNSSYTDGGNNLTADPLFANPATDDLRLTACSSAANRGSNALFTAVSSATGDVAGLPRIVNGVIDMGAHEFQGTAGVSVAVVSSGTLLTCATRSLTLTATGSGTGLLWNTTETTPSIVVSTSGVYSVTATGANGCTAVATSVTITQNTATPGTPDLTASPSGVLSCAQPSLTLTASAAGNGLTYTFFGPSGALPGTGNTREITASGQYSMTATGANGCTATANKIATGSVILPTVSLLVSGTLSCARTASATLTASTTSTGSFSYAFSGPGVVSQNATAGTAVVNVSGTYSVRITNLTTGCFSTTSLPIESSLNVPPPVTLVFNNLVTVLGTGIPTITVPNTPGQSFRVLGGSSYERMVIVDRINGYEIRQTDSSPTGVFAINRVGLFSITVTTADGCSRTVQGILANP